MGEPTETLRAARNRLSDYEQMIDAATTCIPCKLCGGKAVISDAGIGAGYYITCENSRKFRPHTGCMIGQERLGGWAYNVADWWNRLHALAAAIPPEQDGYAEGYRQAVVDAAEEADANAHADCEVAESIAAMIRKLVPTTPTDRHAEGRIAGLEEAAKIADEQHDRFHPEAALHGRRATCRLLAERFRSAAKVATS